MMRIDNAARIYPSFAIQYGNFISFFFPENPDTMPGFFIIKQKAPFGYIRVIKIVQY
jgi:hypothetical protein